MTALRRAAAEASAQLIMALFGLAVGVVAGTAAALFGMGLSRIAPFAEARFSFNVWFMPLAGLLTAAIFRLFGDGRQGMGAVLAAARGEGECVGLRTVAFQFAGTWSAHLFCASVGREGAAVQIGAAIGGNIGRSTGIAGADRTLLVAGMAAGFSALFMTPLAAFFFALEVTFCGKLRPRVLLPAFAASAAAYFTASCLGLARAEIQTQAVFSVGLCGKALLLGGACGLAGLLFSLSRKFFRAFFSAAAPDPFVRAAAAGVLLACLSFLASGRYAGLGTGLISAAEAGGVYPLDWLLKILFTAATLGAGFIGGEVTTMFAAGAVLGTLLAEPFGIPADLALCLGYAAVFGASTRTLAAPVFLGGEVFGFGAFPWLVLACAAARVTSLGTDVYGNMPKFSPSRKKRLPLPKPLYGVPPKRKNRLFSLSR